MAFQPDPGSWLVIGDVAYQVSEHPSAPGVPHFQEGRAGTVYQLRAESGELAALKVFKARFRDPSHVVLATRLSALATVPGLAACRQRVLSPRRHTALLKQEPDLLYAALMPWIDGPTWTELVLTERQLTAIQSLQVARALTDVLQGLEERGLAHCDLSGPNVLLPGFADGPAPAGLAFVELVDVDQLYGRTLDRPGELPAGSAGYAHQSSLQGQWGPRADRFSGAVLIAEMLCWCNPRVRATAAGESFFPASDLQGQDSPRFRRLASTLRDDWGARLAELFEQAWLSPSLAECPPFGEWLLALPGDDDEAVGADAEWQDPEIDELYQRAMEARRAGEWAESVRFLQAVVTLNPQYPLSGTDQQLLDEYESTSESRPLRTPSRPRPPSPRHHIEIGSFRPSLPSLSGLSLPRLLPVIILGALGVLVIVVLALSQFRPPGSLTTPPTPLPPARSPIPRGAPPVSPFVVPPSAAGVPARMPIDYSSGRF